MDNLLIDYRKIVENHDLNTLRAKIGPVPPTPHSIGLVLRIPASQLKSLEDLPKGGARVQRIDHPDFVARIEWHVFVLYDKKRRRCEVLDAPLGALDTITPMLLSNLPNDVVIYKVFRGFLDDADASAPNRFPGQAPSDIVDEYVTNGFGQPFVCEATTPLGLELKVAALCMSKENAVVDPDRGSALSSIEYVKRAKGRAVCSMNIRIGEKSVKYVRHACDIGSTVNSNGTITQKELAGVLRVGKVTSGDRIVHDLEVDHDSVIHGNEEDVVNVRGTYIFHTHPREAYKNHNVTLGWPSFRDYLVFMNAARTDGTVLHMILSVEGMYVMSLSEFWAEHKDDLDAADSFIRDNYEICFDQGNTTEWYIAKIRAVKYKGAPIFDIKFVQWKDVEEGRVVRIYFAKTGKSCGVQVTPVSPPFAFSPFVSSINI